MAFDILILKVSDYQYTKHLIDANRALIDITRKCASGDTAPDSSALIRSLNLTLIELNNINHFD